MTDLYPKYSVTKNYDIEGKHIACDYFVLDLTHDTVARVALMAYAKELFLERDRASLGYELVNWLRSMKEIPKEGP